MRKRLFPALFIIVFMVISLIMAGIHVSGAYTKTESPTLEKLWVGTWSPEFEKSLNESLPIFKPSQSFWGQAEYALFHQGRKGVLVGQDGWLFTDEEFSCLPHAVQNMQQNLTYIADVQKILQGKGVNLAVIVIPAKARVYADKLGSNVMPECRHALYADILQILEKQGVLVTGLLDGFSNSGRRESLYLKTDTHWTSDGARMAAFLLASNIDKSGLDNKNFFSKREDLKQHSGDLLRYLPGVTSDVIKHDELRGFTTREFVAEQEGGDEAADLFSDDVPPITLVGTSYSANPLWNFHGFLKEAFQVDILNMADEGLGPFTVMDKYMNSNAWKDTPPKLVIWEIPERYITTKSGFLDKKDS